MTSLENYINDEERKMCWLDKILFNNPKILNTQDLISRSRNLRIDKEEIIRPSIFIKIVSVLFLLFAFGCWVILFHMLLNKTLVPVTVVLLVFVSFIIWLLIWNKFFNRKYNFTIKLCKDHIVVNKKVFSWI